MRHHSHPQEVAAQIIQLDLSDKLSDLTKSLRIVDFWCWTHAEVLILLLIKSIMMVSGWLGTITKLVEICGS